jgi:hypothetical protein
VEPYRIRSTFSKGDHFEAVEGAFRFHGCHRSGHLFIVIIKEQLRSSLHRHHQATTHNSAGPLQSSTEARQNHLLTLTDLPVKPRARGFER